MEYLLASYCGDPASAHFMGSVIAPVIGTALATMLCILALYYLAANFFRKSEYESFVSIELYQVGVSALLFMFVFGSACFASEIADEFAGGDMFDVAHQYLHTISNQVALPAILALEKTKLVAQWWGSVQFRWGLTIWGTTIPGFPAFILVERVIDFLLMLLSPFVASLMAQEIGMEIIEATMIPFLLPAGVVLRIFPPTRDAGSFLICTALAFGIVFPYTYVLHNKIVGGMIAQQNNAPNSENWELLLGGNPGLIASVNEFDVWNADIEVLFQLRQLSFVVMQAIFLPALSMTLTIAVIKGMQKFMSQKLE